MDWISGSVDDEFVVVTDEDLLEMFQSPDSWLPRGTSKPESFNSKMSINQADDDKRNQLMMFEDEQGEFSLQESEQSINSIVSAGGWFQNPSCRNLIPDLQFNDPLTHMDSMLEPGMIDTEYNNDTSYRLLFEPQFILSTPVVDGFTTDMNFDLQTSTCASNNTSINLNYYPVEKVFQYSSYGVSNGHCYVDNASLLLEECLLYELGMAMTRLPESTRLCFRDFFYRLSYDSSQHTQMQAVDNEIKRSLSEESAESGTNFIDRVVANFMCRT